MVGNKPVIIFDVEEREEAQALQDLMDQVCYGLKAHHKSEPFAKLVWIAAYDYNVAVHERKEACARTSR